MNRALFCLVVISFAGCTSVGATPTDVSGQWILQMERDFRDNPGPPVECTFKQRRNQLAVKCGTGVEMNGEISGRKLSWGFEIAVDDDRVTVSYIGELNTSGTSLTGTWQLRSSTLDKTGSFNAHRKQ